MDNIFSSSLTVLYVNGISLKTSIAEAVYLTEQLKNDKIQRYHNEQEKYYLFKALLYLNMALTGNLLNHAFVHLILRTVWRVPMGLTVSRKMSIVKPLGAKIDKL